MQSSYLETILLSDLPPDVPLSPKIIPVVALDLLFPNLQVLSNSDMRRGIGDNFPTMC